MNLIRPVSDTRSNLSRSAVHWWVTNGVAAATLVVILVSLVVFWPANYLGFNFDPLTGIVALVEPGSPADIGGLQVDDRILTLYDRSLDEVISSVNILTLVGPPDRLVPIGLERAGVVRVIALTQKAPATAFQAAKITNFLLALLCWLTGYILGVVHRHEATGTPLVAWFWLCIGGVLGSYLFAWFASYPLRLGLQWLLTTVLIPLAIYIHMWFPVRYVKPERARMAWIALIGSWVLLNSSLAASVVIWRPSLVRLVAILSDILTLATLVAFIVIGVILHGAYRHTAIAHARRQIRLIVMACFFVAAAWLLLLVVPNFLYGDALIADHWINLLPGVVPLAYLVGDVVRDLYRIDRVLLRLAAHMGTILVLAGVLTVFASVLVLQGMWSILWTALCFVTLYRPVHHLGLRLLPVHANPLHNTYQALHVAANRLTASLDAHVLIDAVCTGIRATFGAPALAFYSGNIEGSNELTLVMQERLRVPETIGAGALTDHLCRLGVVTESRALYAALAQVSPIASEDALQYKGVVLWCPLRHTQGYLLGVLLLGMRGDLDTYRIQDIQELQRLLAAAALALANSAAYMRQCEAEATVRQLYQRLEQERYEMAAAIARDLHDEVINLNIRLNIQSIQQLIDLIHDPDIQAELEELLQSERTEAPILRRICEELHPTGMDDPLGLSALLRMQAKRIQSTWCGTCCVRVVIPSTTCFGECSNVPSVASPIVAVDRPGTALDIAVQATEKTNMCSTATCQPSLRMNWRRSSSRGFWRLSVTPIR